MEKEGKQMLSFIGGAVCVLGIFLIGFFCGSYCLGVATRDKAGEEFYKEWISKLGKE